VECGEDGKCVGRVLLEAEDCVGLKNLESIQLHCYPYIMSIHIR
jgi:hypothetical protein